jgi:glutaconate CoA-transferase subunit A
MKLMNEALASEEGTAAYVRDFVESYRDIPSYLDLIGRDRRKALQTTFTKFLLDPYRRWIMPPDEVEGLRAESAAA